MPRRQSRSRQSRSRQSRSRQSRTVRTAATVSALGLALSLAAVAPGGSAAADAPARSENVLPADPAGSAEEVRGVIAHLPSEKSFALAPELAAIYGQDTLSADRARELLAGGDLTAALGGAAPGIVPAPTPEVGATRMWPALDVTGTTNGGAPLPLVGQIYLKEYTLLGKRDNIEVWVVSGTDHISTGTKFPEGDCRTQVPDTTLVTPEQAQRLADEFQDRILPVESEQFSVAPPADGTGSIGQLPLLGLDWRGDGDSVVTLVDNVRDPNFYDFANNRTYIAGFVAPIFGVITNRNVMTIDAYDWIHRTGANPPNDPDEDICLSRPARPHLYEGVFAHEYQHLLMQYIDPAEENFINEGLSDMAPMFVGYADPRRSVKQTNAESHIFCFHGYGETKGPSNPNPNPCGGPEQSLTLWGDQGGNSDILADYGNAWSFLVFLNDRYGQPFISALHNDAELQGLASVAAALDRVDPGTEVTDVLHSFQLMNLLDNTVSAKGVKLIGAEKSALSTPGLHARVNLDSEFAYAMTGAAPNGADYVRLRDAGDEKLSGKALESLTFTGSPSLQAGSDAVPVENFHLSLVGISESGKRVLVRSFDDAFEVSLSAAQLKEFAGYSTVIAVVAVDDEAGALPAYVPYTLTVNGVEQPGGA